jgi:phospholipid-binding lipoprotein MlaA
LTLGPVVLAAFFLCLSPLHTWADGPDPDTGTEVNAPAAGKQVEETGSSPAATAEKPSDQYGDVTGQEAEGVGTRIADPIEPWNRAMYHVNDKLYFWLLKPTTKAYKYAVPEGFRGLIGNFYQNIKAPVRIVNNFLQGKPHYAALELARFLVNSTVGVGGLRECATQCFGITGREADFGQTLGKYGVGTGFYIVWPLLGPSSPRDTVGWAADLALTPTFYVSSQWFSPETVGLYALDKVNYTSFHLGDYEALKAAAIDPYVAMRDAYVQYRKKAVEQ